MFRKLFTANAELQRLQDNVAQAFAEIERRPHMGGVILSGVSLASGVDTRVDHGLERKPTGWIVIDKNATGDIWKSSTANPREELSLILRSNAALTVSLWIF